MPPDAVGVPNPVSGHPVNRPPRTSVYQRPRSADAGRQSRTRRRCSAGRSRALAALAGALRAGKVAVSGRGGAISAMFAVTLTSLLGMVGLGTEVGYWYIEKRTGQNAVDAAAAAGAMSLAAASTALCSNATAKTAATNAATYVTRQNGFSTGVAINCPPTLGSYSGNNSAIEVIATRNPTPVLASLFVPSVTVNTRAVGAVQPNSFVCILGLDPASGVQDFTQSGSSVLVAPNCVVASNGVGSQSIDFSGSAAITAYTLVSSGGCVGCTGSTVHLSKSFLTNQPATANPFAAIWNPANSSGVTIPSFTSCLNVTVAGGVGTSTPVACSSCSNINLSSGTTTLQPYETNGNKAYCPLQTNNGATLNFTPGAYFFWNGNVNFQGGTVKCTSCSVGSTGVTLITTGSPPASKTGIITINGSASVTLNAPITSGYDPQNNGAFNGVLFYVDGRYTGGSQVSINGSATTALSGGLYFPSNKVALTGGTQNSTCIELVAFTVTLSGNTTNACKAAGTTPVGAGGSTAMLTE
jgi:Flp pilus assembly protein TadG